MTRRSLASEAGFSLTELLISTAIMLTVTGAIFSLMNPAQGNAKAQPEVADVQQRMRVGTESIFKELMMAGAGPYQGAITGSLVNFFAPMLPRRVGDTLADPTRGAGSFKTDVLSFAYIPNTYSQTTISDAMPPNSSELKVNDCPSGADLSGCGFVEGMEVIIFDNEGHFDTFTITRVQDDAGHLQHRGDDLNYRYEPGAMVTEIVQHTLYLNRATNQLMKYDGHASDLPLVDNVVDLRFDYYGDPAPPLLPKPVAPAANCLYDGAGNYVNLPTLVANEGSLSLLTEAQLTDGPFCGSGDNEFDADLLRVRKVRVTLRVQAASPTLRGSDPAFFRNPGTAQGGDRYVPDYILSFDVTPRNLNLTR